MPTAFVLIKTETAYEADVLKDVKKVKGVDEAFAVYGEYDIIARVSAESMNKLNDIVTWRIRRISDKITKTILMIVDES